MDTSKRDVTLLYAKSRPHVPPCPTHHNPGFPLAVSQKKWLKRSLVLKLPSIVVKWRREPPGQPTYDCGREPLIPHHMTRSSVIRSGSDSTWSKWANSQRVYTLKVTWVNLTQTTIHDFFKDTGRNEEPWRLNGSDGQFATLQISFICFYC